MAEHYNDNHLKDSDTVYQWGFYFNYGNNLNPNDILTLINAQLSATFHNQTFLPSSIKVFEVPADLVSDGQVIVTVLMILLQSLRVEMSIII